MERHPRLVETTRKDATWLRRLLFAADRSAASRAARLAVAGLAMGGGREVVVLHVDDREQPEEGRKLVSEIACGLIALAVNARPELRQARHGHVAAEIAAAAAEHGSDLVVLGSRGRSDVGGLLLGSVGREVLERVGCPVLLVRAGRRASARHRRVLVAMAGDEDLTDLVRTTATVAELDGQVLVLHLRRPGDGKLELDVSAQLVEQVVTGLRRWGVRARGPVHAGRRGTGEDIARTALGYGADAVVMGSSRLPALTALLRGSMPGAVVRRSEGPVPVSALGDGGKPPQE